MNGLIASNSSDFYGAAPLSEIRISKNHSDGLSTAYAEVPRFGVAMLAHQSTEHFTWSDVKRAKRLRRAKAAVLTIGVISVEAQPCAR